MPDMEAALSRFESQVEKSMHRWFRNASMISERRYNFIKIRIHINAITFIDVYHNAGNKRGSYALIRQGKRIFGYDNVKAWHRHPLGDSEKHEPCIKPRLSKVLGEMKRIVESLPAGEENV